MRTRWREAGARARGHRAAVAGRLGLRAGRRRAAHADAGARPLEPDRPRCCWSTSARAATGSAAPASRRSTARIGDVPPDLDDPRRLAGFFAAVRELRDAGLLLAYHDRSDGGLAITLLEMAFAGRAGLDVDLGASRRPMRGALQRGAGRRAPVARARTSRARSRCSRATASPTLPRRIGAASPGRRVRIAAGGRTLIDDDRVRPARELVGDELAHAAAARRPGLRRRGTGRAARRGGSGTLAGSSVRPGRGHRGADDRDRRAAAGRDPARAGRQQPGRDGGRLRPRRLRAGRRAHDRPDRPRRVARRTSRGSSPAADSATATCSARARAGPSRSCSTRARATLFERCSRARDASRSASATAARCSPRSPS